MVHHAKGSENRRKQDKPPDPGLSSRFLGDPANELLVLSAATFGGGLFLQYAVAGKEDLAIAVLVVAVVGALLLMALWSSALWRAINRHFHSGDPE
jgi:hypothetical protein